jgi:hypothetical protein
MIEIRRMELKDIPEVVEIDRSSFTLPWTERSFKYEVQENTAARCWVTIEDERVASMLVLWIIVDEAHIATIATRESRKERLRLCWKCAPATWWRKKFIVTLVLWKWDAARCIIAITARTRS